MNGLFARKSILCRVQSIQPLLFCISYPPTVKKEMLWTPEPAEVLKAFKLFEIPAIDKDKAGYVRQSSLIHALSNLSGEKLSRSEATELLSQMPAPDEQGFINYADYISMMAQ